MCNKADTNNRKQEQDGVQFIQVADYYIHLLHNHIHNFSSFYFSISEGVLTACCAQHKVSSLSW